MRAILIHGMGRTPASMVILGIRLRFAGIRPSLFAYSPTFEKWDGCVKRLARFIERRTAGKQYIIVGHSLGTVLTRGVLPQLSNKPVACFFIAPPSRASKVARKFAPRFLYRLLTGEMGQLLADEKFMAALPLPSMPTRIYAGTKGLPARFSFFGDEPNDGILTVKETEIPNVPVQTIPAMHTFIMNRKAIARDIVETLKKLYEQDKDQG